LNEAFAYHSWSIVTSLVTQKPTHVRLRGSAVPVDDENSSAA